MTDVLTTRVLNRTTLRRQLLLERHDHTPAEAIEHLVGLQAQATNSPYVALWSRLKGFGHDQLSDLVLARTAVRTHLMRGTLHLVTARDCYVLRPVLQSMLVRTGRGVYARQLEGVDFDELAKAARVLLDEEPRTTAQLGEVLAGRWPEYDARPLGAVIPTLVPVVQVPPRGLWGRSGQPLNTSVANWLGDEVAPDSEPDEVILRYLAVFGPATVADVGAWSKMTGLREPFERLRPKLRVYRDEEGRELFDVPDGAIEDPDVPAPPRFLPEFDNVLLSHADRTRIMSEEHRKRWGNVANAVFPASFLVNGFLRGTWRLEKDALVLKSYAKVSKKDQTALEREAKRLLDFLAPGKGHEIRLMPLS
jgi:hypothetical protein